MSEDYSKEHKVIDRFEIDKAFETRFAFPCCVCLHRHGTDRDEPCIRCEHNLIAGYTK